MSLIPSSTVPDVRVFPFESITTVSPFCFPCGNNVAVLTLIIKPNIKRKMLRWQA